MKQRDLIIILAPLLILTILWVMFTIYHSLTTSTIEDPLSIQIVPISGNFDTKTLNELKNRQRVEPEYGASFTSLSETPTPTPEGLEQVSSESAQQSGESNLP